MKITTDERNRKKFLFNFGRFLIFFILMAFVVTCNLVLFLHWVDLTTEEMKAAVPITFLNVIILTFIFSMIDEIRRTLMVRKPIARIQAGLDEIMSGNFKTQIPYIRNEKSSNEFDAIIKGINELAVELSGVETLRTDFISNVSHEIKTPLAAIQNYGTLLQGHSLSEKQKVEYAKAITEQTRRLSGLITNILKLNRLENQQIFPERKYYNLTEQIRECLLLYEQSWASKNINIETDLEEDIFIHEDAELLSLVWNNLFSNAIKFTDNGGAVGVKVKKEGLTAFVEVSDSGCGISPETGKHIFEKFYQGDTSHAVQGNGLGLALVKKVIDIVGGDIHVQSTLGEGSTFTVYLRESVIK
ncbi:HAMP domain-containing histidine kinase [Pradoshia sp. D12]|uniref:HAMP domain-containing sensor histidine kinase n=2 Tax=Bacillales TaxID=1385 RepID=UPI001124B0AF|nr:MULTISPECIES: HAMP domain-containing sensor histidine kinase [unclassified Bacillus (in: firmicutes)]QFK70145.1 HAMP domain-containing histidine kinase [Pradoshia sp. D12]TPF70925.1 HAMP domain-containing histidine kinase [Bacillus sp. D12]